MKTEKEKQLEMWEWLAEHPGKNKTHYETYLLAQGRGVEYNYCWACEVDSHFHSNCSHCPISFPEDRCTSPKSPFKLWMNAIPSDATGEVLVECLKNSRKHALSVVDLIKETWKDE